MTFYFKKFLLEVKNSMKRTEEYKEGTTKKKKDKDHGIGLKNVGDIVHKYHGVINIKAQEGIFRISILIPLKDTVHDIKEDI